MSNATEKLSLKEALGQRILTGDGAMGTYLYQMGFPVGVSYEEFNLLRPDVIENVHRRYYEAGARVIETNTFSANLEKLAIYGLDAEMEAINRAGVRIARAAAGSDAYVVGAVGSIRAGKLKNIRTAKVSEAYERQMEAMLSEGVDGLLLETFYDFDEMMLALRIARKLTPDVPVICQFAAEDVGRTQDGTALKDAFDQLQLVGADVVGFNCRSGPNGILRAIDAIDGPVALPLSVFPNAGIPDYVDGKYSYSAGPDYFAETARRFADRGARIIGGCCGTTPEHVKAMAEALKDYVPAVQNGQAVAVAASAAPKSETITVAGKPEVAVVSTVADRGANDAANGQPVDPNIVDLVKQRHTVIVELDPPRDLDIRKFMDGAAALKACGADAITMADNSLAVTRMSNLALGALVQEKIGLRPLVHIACRDRNLIGTQSHMMGLDALGIDHVLAVTGDPARFGDLPDSSSVYDLTSFEMIKMIKQLNEGIAFSGKPLKQKAKFVVGAAFNPNVKHLDKAVQRLERKIKSGADYIMTQPVYDPALIEQIAVATKHLDVPVFIGIMPLASGRNAEYLHNEVPGIQLSDSVRQRMAGLEGEAGRAEGVRISQELLDVAIKHFKGIYFMTPFMFYDMAVQLTEYVWAKTGVGK
ncbi:bifunctional homocysteine S-methyltransferase/methylenetetrahydrofolate reductase [Paenibacillus sp. NEAU-GSW1]|uniref:bifunctional homocysteine S-methyltransferase/methylenetetrahydrofolate reductase n=1 Tax=Paenibacillus sp. NEAU-GSW1 TaxID=2682486 RepID=UPI0012E240A1|nr:bifunctional homocysteine S-methyltransferase/methylenetetrahydrofolate reductase [Paenibacillus sp. NEAU-GSW1]MUT66807.1 bifunctional homocysteine S-methyltransferase/methylenetetrahydrofolate reductase [Paenibacillus sp. NEAU-GSW1]